MSGCGLLFKVALHKFGRLERWFVPNLSFLNSLSDSFAVVLRFTDNLGAGHMA